MLNTLIVICISYIQFNIVINFKNKLFYVLVKILYWKNQFDMNICYEKL